MLEVHVLHDMHFVLKRNKNAKPKVSLLEVQVLGPRNFNLFAREVHLVFPCSKTHKKLFLCFKIILSIHKEVQLLFGSNLISKRK